MIGAFIKHGLLDKTTLKNDSDADLLGHSTFASFVMDLLGKLADGIFMMDADGVISAIHPKVENLLGRERDQICGKNLSDFICDRSPDDLSHDMELGHEIYMRHAGGEIIPLTLRIVGMRENDEDSGHNPFEGQSMVAVTDMRDIRRLKKEYEALQQQMIHAQRVESLGVLASGIGHNLNNALLPMMTLTDLVLSQSDSKNPHHRLLEKIYSAQLRVRDLVKDMMRLSRYESRQMEPLHLQQLIENTVDFMRSSLPVTVQIITKATIADSEIMGETSALEQVWMNLINNAVAAMKGRGVIRITLTREAKKNKDYIRIDCQDTGPGIPKKVMNKIFDPFFTTKEVGEGTGLGLSTAHSTIARHHGWIDVSSVPKQGALFSIYLPLIRKES